MLSFASLCTTKPKMWPLTDKLTFHHEIATGRARELGHSSACHQGLCYRKYAVSFSVIGLILFGMKALAQMILPGLSIPVLTFGRSTWITVMKKKKSILFAAWMIPSSRKFSICPGVLNRQVASRLRKGSSQGSMPYSWAAPLGSYLHSSSMGLNTLKGKSQVGILRILAVQLKKNLTCIFLTLGELISKAVHTQLQWLCKWGLSDKEENQYDTHWGLIVLQKFSRRKILVPNFERREVRFCSITGIS